MSKLTLVVLAIAVTVVRCQEVDYKELTPPFPLYYVWSVLQAGYSQGALVIGITNAWLAEVPGEHYYKTNVQIVDGSTCNISFVRKVVSGGGESPIDNVKIYCFGITNGKKWVRPWKE